jgi:acetyl-CoA C-acetyltransferase
METVDAVVTFGVRNPHGRYGGSLRDISVVDLSAQLARAALERAGVPAEDVDEVILSNCRQAGNGPNPGRQVALKAGVREEVPAQTINMACASGLKSIQLAHQSVALGISEVVLVVAGESMSRMPYLASHELRWEGVRRGDIALVDGWRDGGTDPICGLSMGQTAENIAKRHDITRAEQDAWSVRSHERVRAAWDAGHFLKEVVPVALDGGLFERDETFRTDATIEKIASLKPAFITEGTVTAGNSSQMADGAAAVLVMSVKAARRYGLKEVARLRGFAAVGVDPTLMGIGPDFAIPRALEVAGLSASDIDLYEINEAFAAQIVHNVRELKLDEDAVNVNGGGIALGHPTGQSGVRIVVSLLHELARRDQQFGVASLCVGGGQGVAAAVERVDLATL